MASFPANVYGGGCKRLQEWLQTFAGTVAMLCVREGQNWHRNVSPILDKRNGRRRDFSALMGMLLALQIGICKKEEDGLRDTSPQGKPFST